MQPANSTGLTLVLTLTFFFRWPTWSKQPLWQCTHELLDMTEGWRKAPAAAVLLLYKSAFKATLV